jgi:integrase
LKPTASATVEHAPGVLSTALGRAASRGHLTRNPASDVRRPKDRNVKMRPIGAEQAARLVASVKETRKEAFYALAVKPLAVKLGLHQSELAGLFRSDLDGTALTVRRSFYTHGAGNGWRETKTGEARTIRRPTSASEALERHRAMQA